LGCVSGGEWVGYTWMGQGRKCSLTNSEKGVTVCIWVGEVLGEWREFKENVLSVTHSGEGCLAQE